MSWLENQEGRQTSIFTYNNLTHHSRLYFCQVELSLPKSTHWLTELQISAQSLAAFELPWSVLSSQCCGLCWVIRHSMVPGWLKTSLLEQPQILGKVGRMSKCHWCQAIWHCLRVKSLALRCEESADCRTYPWRKLQPTYKYQRAGPTWNSTSSSMLQSLG